MSRRTVLSLIVAAVFGLAIGAANWPTRETSTGSAAPKSANQTNIGQPGNGGELDALPTRVIAPDQKESVTSNSRPENSSPHALTPPELRELPLSQLWSLMKPDQNIALPYVLEALRRWHGCRNYVRHPEGRNRRLENLIANGQDTEAQENEWETLDAECPQLDTAFADLALKRLIEAADAGSFEAQEAYYRWGLAHQSGAMVRNPELARAYVERMRRYLEPLLTDQPPYAFDLLFNAFREGWVFPRDYMRSATYRFASYYYQGLPAAEIDRRRIAWGRNLTDAEIDTAEQAGYALFMSCCGQ